MKVFNDKFIVFDIFEMLVSWFFSIDIKKFKYKAKKKQLFNGIVNDRVERSKAKYVL